MEWLRFLIGEIYGCGLFHMAKGEEEKDQYRCEVKLKHGKNSIMQVLSGGIKPLENGTQLSKQASLHSRRYISIFYPMCLLLHISYYRSKLW